MNNLENVVVFGGAYAHKKYLDLAYNVGKELAENGFTTITGGGSGMMEQVNKGAYEAGGKSLGIRLNGVEEKLEQEYFTEQEQYDVFSERHDRLLSLGQAFVVLPGGLGTILEALDITQRKKFEEVPLSTHLIFVGSYFRPLTKTFRDIAKEGFIPDSLEDLYQYAQNPKEMVEVLMARS